MDEYRDQALCQALVKKIGSLTCEDINLMEVCGTHTMAIFREGLKDILPHNIHLISGPGCPVCVTPLSAIDKMIALSRLNKTVITTFGDMMNVPGSSSNLKYEKARGATIKIVYSPFQALEIATQYPKKKIILIGIGFETTTPLLASVVLEAKKRDLTNFYLLSYAKLMPPVMRALLADQKTKIDGFICPGHVSAIIGTQPYQFIPRDYHIPCVIAGFEPVDILFAIYRLVLQKVTGEPYVENQYRRAVNTNGNRVALQKMKQVFQPANSQWRGLGRIPFSGLELKAEYGPMNAHNIAIQVEPTQEHPDCCCGEVLRGLKTPLQCPLFKSVCTPENPVGACMVSSEGSCAAYYKYNKHS